MKMQFGLILSIGLLGCQAAGDDDATDSSGTELSYYQDIKPILDAHCVSCHNESGIGTFPLTTFEEVDVVRSAVANAIETGSMPPWKPTDGCNDYLYDPRLDQSLIDTVTEWVDGGAPEGSVEDEGDAMDGPGEGHLSQVDHTLSMQAPYVPQSSPDDYRCFLVDWPFEEDNYVTGYAMNPDNESLVHHIITFIAEPSTVEAFEAADAADEGEGWSCYGGPGGDVNVGDIRWLGSWAPGGQKGDFPEGTGIPMTAGSKLVLQIHLNTEEAETSSALVSMDVSVETEVERPALIQPWTNPQWVFGGSMDIPANTENVTHEWGYAVPDTYVFEIHSAALHMHTFGQSGRFFVEHQDGTETCILNIDDWDFNWQKSYDLLETVTLVEGDKLSVSCTWDNPTDQDINWGDGTGDEMCLATMFVTKPHDSE